MANAIDVDPKTVERWVTTGRTPYRRHRYAVASQLGLDETYLWPDALTPDQVAGASESEILTVYPHRWAVPSDLWRRMFETAERDIGVLVYSGLFLSEDAGTHQVFRAKADAGVTDSEGRILMIRRSDNGNWAVPGGAMDLGESIAETAVRETLEETGIHCRVTGLVGIYTDPRHLIHYTSNDEVRQEFSIVFAAEYVGGEPTPSDESREVVWVPRDEVQGLKMDRSMRHRIEAYLHGEGLPRLG